MNKLAWHMLPENMTLSYGDGRKAVVGETLWVPDDGKSIEVCQYGMHGCFDILDCILYAGGPMICRVRLLDAEPVVGDKAVARGRKVLWAVNGKRLLRVFACDCAERALGSVESPDPRAIEAIRVSRLYANGKATPEQLWAAGWSCPSHNDACAAAFTCAAYTDHSAAFAYQPAMRACVTAAGDRAYNVVRLGRSYHDENLWVDAAQWAYCKAYRETLESEREWQRNRLLTLIQEEHENENKRKA